MGWHSSGCKLSRELKLWRERLNHCRMRMAKTVSNMGSPFPSSRHNPNLSWLRVKTECIQTIHHAPSIQEIEGNSWSFYHQMYHDGKKPLSIFEFSIEARSFWDHIGNRNLRVKMLDFFQYRPKCPLFIHFDPFRRPYTRRNAIVGVLHHILLFITNAAHMRINNSLISL